MTVETIDRELMDAVLDGAADYIDKHLDGRVRALQARLDALELRAAVPGPRGEQGAPGIDGKDGAPGVDGRDGAAGRDGIDGKDGAPGIDGKDGVPGQDGSQGPAGRDGIDGRDGKDGAPGEHGIDGKDGADGLPGEAGKDGKDGAAGRDGLDGKDGAPGRDGIDGKDGAAGLDGKDGAAGRDGRDIEPEIANELTAALAAAKSAIEYLTGEIEYLKALPTAPAQFMIADGVLKAVSVTGEVSDLGRVRGADGRNGATPVEIDVDAEGCLVIRLSDTRVIKTANVRGPPGRDGTSGANGKDGRDALEIGIRSGLDPERSYAEGTIARCRGGLLRAVRQTDPVTNDDYEAAGWFPIMEGIAELREVQHDSGRTVERTFVFTGGRKSVFVHRTATPILRGVWRAGDSYQRGDMTIRDGSVWHCEQDTSAQPGASPDWRLAAKRGADGKAASR